MLRAWIYQEYLGYVRFRPALNVKRHVAGQAEARSLYLFVKPLGKTSFLTRGRVWCRPRGGGSCSGRGVGGKRSYRHILRVSERAGWLGGFERATAYACACHILTGVLVLDRLQGLYGTFPVGRR
jgi:hypothetical protein